MAAPERENCIQMLSLRSMSWSLLAEPWGLRPLVELGLGWGLALGGLRVHLLDEEQRALGDLGTGGRLR